MTTETEALRQKFERHIVATGRSEGELIFEAGHYLYPDVQEIWELYQAGYAAAKSETAAAGISDAAVQALESIAAMTFDRWSEGYRAGQIAIAALDKLRVQTTEWGPAPVGNEADEPMSLADRLDLMADAQAAGSTAQSDLYAAATVWRKHLRGQPAPTQADSAPGDEAQRGV